MLTIKNVHWIILIIITVFSFVKAFNKEKLLNQFNDRRRALAKRLEIKNMWEMTWDETLARKADQVDRYFEQTSYGDMARGNNYSVFFTTSVENPDLNAREYEDQEMDKWPSSFIFPLVRSPSYVSLSEIRDNYGEAYTPTQRLIGCVQSHRRIYAALDNMPHVGVINYDLFCLVGPYGTQLGTIHYGLPLASMCGPEGVADDDGILCIVDKNYHPFLPTTESPKKEKTSENVPEKSNEDDKEYDLVLWLDAAEDKGTILSFLLILLFMIVV